MKSIVSWFARNPVASNLLMLTLVIGGLFSLRTIKIELFPEFSLDAVTVSVIYPGASPEEIEEGICIKIEEEVHGIEGVGDVMSTAVEGVGSVVIEVNAGEDERRILDDVKTRVDAIDTFPDEAEKPVIGESRMRAQVINVAVYGDVAERTLKESGELIRDGINALEGISQVELVNARPYEISIEVSEEQLKRYGLTFDAVADAVRASSIDLSGGSIKSAGGEILLRTDTLASDSNEYSNLVLRTGPDGSRVLLGDVASVLDAFEDTDQTAKFNGQPAVMVQVFRVGDESALDISAVVEEYLVTAATLLPPGVAVQSWQDGAEWLQGRLDLLIKNGLQGLVLVFFVLALFLRFRLSFWVTLGIPISFLGTVLVMPWFDQSINMLSLFAFILVLGIVVDDAIIVGENIFKEQEDGGDGVDAAVRGVRGVAIPVVFAVLTTIVAFLPMVFLPGVIGKFFGVIPLAVIPALAFSVIESQMILPSHLSHSGGFGDRLAKYAPFKWWISLQSKVGAGLSFVINRLYRPSLEVAMAWRYVTISVAIAVLVLTFGAVGGGLVKFVFFPDIEGDIIAAQITFPQGTSAAVTKEAVEQIEAAAALLVAEVEGEGAEGTVVRSFMGSIGEQPYLAQQQRTAGVQGIVGSQYGEVVMELISAEDRGVTATELVNRWRELCGMIPGAIELNFNSALMSAGAPIDIQLSGEDVDELRATANELKTAIAGYPGLYDVTDSFRGGKQEMVLDVLPAAEAVGISRRDLARQVRQGFYGEEAQRIQRGRDDVKVMVRYPAADRDTTFGIERMRIRSPEGVEIPFSEVAQASSRRGYATISRTNRARNVRVTAEVDLAIANPGEVLSAIESEQLDDILARHPTVTASLEGQSSDQRDFMSAMIAMYSITMLAIFALMAIPFRSYLQPLIVMSAIPFGLVGAIWGHALMGIDLSSLSMLGIAALAGVVVNDSLVLVDFVNRERDAGFDPLDAARRAGMARFRPIILTSLTTFVGLMPLILERSVQAQFLIPMAVSLAFGVLFSTFVTLIFVPCAYMILADVKRAWLWLYGPREEDPEDLDGVLA